MPVNIVKWQQYVSGMVDGALAILALLTVDREEKERLMAEAVGLSRVTAAAFVEELYAGRRE